MKIEQKNLNEFNWNGLTLGKLQVLQHGLEEYLKASPNNVLANELLIFLIREMPQNKERR